MSPDQTAVLLVARRAVADSVAAELERDGILVVHRDTIPETSLVDIALIELGRDDWRRARALGASVIVLADHADNDTVTELLLDGVDDVITCADRPYEAVARIRALARRHPPPPPRDAVIVVGDVSLDPSRRRVTVAERDVVLTPRQFDLLEYLLRNAGRVVTRDMLLEQVWDIAATQDLNAVEVQVRRLREAIGDDLRRPTLLRAVRGVGYLYEKG